MKQNLILSICLILFQLLIPFQSLAEISAESYCQLSIQKLTQEIQALKDLTAIEKLGGNKREKKTTLDQEAETLFKSFGITAHEYINYMSKNWHKVERYLRANPAIKQEIDRLTAERKNLLEQYDNLINK
ncbi:Uncharacterized protein dnl_16750 [Desulfonema limicola]|uniref:DUF4296 domain-containing protein n=1 Tax=Desulfonema limicola TaxID=45656 RepID=A0A975B5X6_9BACT|nr:hypothetical protein [Desulfonema limicola]QTA79405.1 Uncharacterized protein dnl_16750 [Desulfonema limicola]